MVDKKTNIEPVSPATSVPVASPAAPPPSASAPPPAHCEPCPPQFRLDTPLRWKAANPLEQKVLQNLQGNILKGHGRDFTTNIFFAFGNEVLASKRLLRELGNFHVTSAYQQLVLTEKFKTERIDGGKFCAAFISSSGYTKLGLTFPVIAGNAAFGPGMKDQSSLDDLSDPKLTNWESDFQKDIHAMVLIADDDPEEVADHVALVEALIVQAGGTVLRKQTGKVIRNAQGNGLEHFGYVDGRSQPLMLMEDIEAESRDEGISHWDPTASLDKVLVADPLAVDLKLDPEGLCFGSFFVFRKLEQRVRDFKRREQQLADALDLVGAEKRERAGALVVGRFEDGTPVTMTDEAKGVKAPRNDFNYSGDPGGSRCPFHAHVRKTNPRGSGGFEELKAEQLHIMARRAITYEDTPRAVHPEALPAAKDMAEFLLKVSPNLPEGDLGLLFMAYNSKLDDQFVFTQRRWANEPAFPKSQQTPPVAAGLDGVIGQGGAGGQSYAKKWDDPAAARVPFDFADFVHMKGGEYFFAPSLRFLRNL